MYKYILKSLHTCLPFSDPESSKTVWNIHLQAQSPTPPHVHVLDFRTLHLLFCLLFLVPTLLQWSVQTCSTMIEIHTARAHEPLSRPPEISSGSMYEKRGFGRSALGWPDLVDSPCLSMSPAPANPLFFIHGPLGNLRGRLERGFRTWLA